MSTYREPPSRRTSPSSPLGAASVGSALTVALILWAAGVRGAYGLKEHLAPLRQLEQWLARHPEWEQAGPPRALFYNGPSKRSADRWCEVQIPVREIAKVKAAPETGRR